VQAKELDKLQKLAALPSEQEALSDRYSKFDEAGEPTHDKEGQPLEGKVSGCTCKVNEDEHIKEYFRVKQKQNEKENINFKIK
jgi:hypothetical protein